MLCLADPLIHDNADFPFCNSCVLVVLKNLTKIIFPDYKNSAAKNVNFWPKISNIYLQLMEPIVDVFIYFSRDDFASLPSKVY